MIWSVISQHDDIEFDDFEIKKTLKSFKSHTHAEFTFH
jgi:hypothetical protein